MGGKFFVSFSFFAIWHPCICPVYFGVLFFFLIGAVNIILFAYPKKKKKKKS